MLQKKKKKYCLNIHLFSIIISSRLMNGVITENNPST